MTMTGPFDYLNEKCNISLGDTGFNKPFALFSASLIGALASIAFDNVKTRH